MDAVISGSAGRALLLERGSLTSFDVDDPSTLVRRKPTDFAYLFGEMQDLRALENTDIESVRRELKHDSDSTLALDLVLISLDAELPDDIRTEAIEGLDELLAEDRVVERVENILYARPLPEDSDLRGALQLCEVTRPQLSSALLRRLEERELFIDEVSEAWDSIPTEVFGDYDQREEFLRTAAREGLFRSFVLNLETQGAPSTFLLNAGLNNSVKQLRNHRQVLQEWTTSFRQSAAAPAVKNETEEEALTEVSPRRRHGRRVGIDRPAILREVNQKKAIIVGAIHRRDFNLVSYLVDDLVAFQLRNGENEYAARSLCDLAIEAKALGMHPLQLELTERSLNVAPDDAWSWAQHGDALLNMNRLDQALGAYQQAKDFGAGVIAIKGRAEVLKAQGQLPAALTAFDEVIRAHPEDVVAKTGRAEVLKAQGQLPAALAAFDEVIRAHPENVVAKTGRAEVLKAQGQLPAALAAFDEVIRAHPENVFAKTGRAEVLKEQGQLPAALAAFDEVIRAHPENVVAKTGRAEVLKAQGQLPAALAAFDEVIRAHPENVVAKHGRSCVLAALQRYDEALADLPSDTPTTPGGWIGFHIRGMIMLRRGDIDEAIQIFQQGVTGNPFTLSKQYFHTALSVALMRRGKYGSARKVLSNVEAQELQPQVNVLLMHCFGEENQTTEASKAYESISAKPWSISDELIEELHRRYVLKQPPQRSDDWVFDQETASILVVANQQAPISNYLS